jgi:hypothetical protein
MTLKFKTDNGNLLEFGIVENCKVQKNYIWFLLPKRFFTINCGTQFYSRKLAIADLKKTVEFLGMRGVWL